MDFFCEFVGPWIFHRKPARGSMEDATDLAERVVANGRVRSVNSINQEVVENIQEIDETSDIHARGSSRFNRLEFSL